MIQLNHWIKYDLFALVLTEHTYSMQQGLLSEQLSPSNLHAEALTDNAAVNAIIIWSKDKRMMCARWYEI
jgi:hypothetical protein